MGTTPPPIFLLHFPSDTLTTIRRSAARDTHMRHHPRQGVGHYRTGGPVGRPNLFHTCRQRRCTRRCPVDHRAHPSCLWHLMLKK